MGKIAVALKGELNSFSKIMVAKNPVGKIVKSNIPWI